MANSFICCVRILKSNFVEVISETLGASGAAASGAENTDATAAA